MPDSPTLPVPKEIPTATKTPAAAAKSSIPKPANTKPSPPSVTSSAQASEFDYASVCRGMHAYRTRGFRCWLRTRDKTSMLFHMLLYGTLQ